MANVDIIIKTIDQTKPGLSSANKNVTGFIAGAGAATTVLTSLAIAAKAAFDFSAQGAKLERLAIAGEEVARQYGGNMDLIIQKIKEASLGTVSEMDIISNANRAMMLGLGADANQLANLMEIAAFRGRAMGVETTKAFSDIVTGVGRGSPLILDNLGIVVNAKETYDKYAASVGKSAGELTKAEKTQALLNRVLDEGNKMLEEAGGLYLDNAGKVEKLSASAKNFADNRKRENADLAGSFSEAASAAIDGYDQMFKFFDTQGAIRERAIRLRDNLDPGGEWQDFYETARTEWASQQIAITQNEQALQDYALAAESAAEQLENISKVNAAIIDGAIDITSAQKDFEEQQADITQAIADTRAEGEKLYPWEAEKIQENKDKLAELGDQYLENQDKFRAAQEERAAMMAIEAIAMSDGIAGYSDAEREKARVILETTDIATAAAFEEQQAIMAMSQAVADGTLPVENWGGVFQSVMADGKSSVEEVQAAIAAVPKDNTITFNIVTNGAPPNLSMSNEPAPVGTRRRANADGGTYMIPSIWGNEGFPLGNSDTASAGELITITPKGGGNSGGSNTPVIVQILLDSATPDPERVAYNLQPAVERAVRSLQQAGKL